MQLTEAIRSEGWSSRHMAVTSYVTLYSLLFLLGSFQIVTNGFDIKSNTLLQWISGLSSHQGNHSRHCLHSANILISINRNQKSFNVPHPTHYWHSIKPNRLAASRTNFREGPCLEIWRPSAGVLSAKTRKPFRPNIKAIGRPTSNYATFGESQFFHKIWRSCQEAGSNEDSMPSTTHETYKIWWN